MTVSVRSVSRIEMLREERPDSVIAGDGYTASVRVFNRGNAPRTVRLDVEAIPAFPVMVSPPVSVIGPNRSQVFEIQVKSDDGLRLRLDQILKVRVRDEGATDGVAVAEQTIVVQVIPRMTGDADPYHRLPARMSLIGIKDGDKTGVQVEFAGSGNIDEAGTRWIDFLFRGPNTLQKGSFGQYDEYRFSYGTKAFDISVGDRPYSLSPLTELYRYGRGVEANIHAGRFGTGAFFLQTRFDDPATRELGAYLQYNLSDSVGLRANILQKERDQTVFSPEQKENVGSLQTKAQYGEKVKLDAEYGLSRSMAGAKDSDSAYRVNLNGRLSEKIWYFFEKLHAGPRFGGFYNNIDMTNASVSFPVFPRLDANLQYRNLKQRFDTLDPAQLEIPFNQRNYKTGISYSFPWKTTISLDYEDFAQRAFLPPSQSDFLERGWALGVRQELRKLTIHASGEIWRLADRVKGSRKGNLERYSLYAFFSPDERQSYGLYAQVGNDRFSGSANRTRTVGLSGQWRPSPKFVLTLDYRRNETEDGQRRVFDIISTGLSWTLPNSHILNLRGQWLTTHDIEDDGSYFLVSYTVPLGIPTAKKTSVGVLRGRVYDSETAGHPPLRKVVLNASGVYAVTDENGEYLFPSLKPGSYYLWVDKASLGFTKVTAGKLPLKIEVVGGAAATLDIAVVTAGSVSGVVVLSDGGVTKGLAQVLVEAKSGERAIRQLTDERGRFSFEELPPGKWTVKIDKDNLPRLHRLEKEAFEVELTPGGKEELEVKVVPRPRQIRILEEGEIREKKK
ncbi:MAG: hypothetical protein HGA78_02800 [Nitrospirales bacterium]|nr:hypothetical protein [Nitrospirales bacterium]